MEPLVSVIVPVYNIGNYLPRCLDCIEMQTYKNLEIILVDDSSTDGSGEFFDEFCKRNERFCVIHHEKSTGVSGPRNTGLKAAKCEYINLNDSVTVSTMGIKALPILLYGGKSKGMYRMVL